MSAALTLYHGDQEEILPLLPSGGYDVVFLDPPYNTKLKADIGTRTMTLPEMRRKRWSNFYANWDDIPDYPTWCRIWLRQAKRLLAPHGSIFVCGSHHNIYDIGLALRDLEFHILHDIAWIIPNAMPHLRGRRMASSNQRVIWARRSADVAHIYNYELVKAANDGKNWRDFWTIPNDTTTGRVYKHPSKKPVELIERCLRMTMPTATDGAVLDFFAGIGTTGVAAQNLAAQWPTRISGTLIERADTETSPYVRQIEQRLAIARSPWPMARAA